jgi:N-acetylneuraminic acid mutarotase
VEISMRKSIAAMLVLVFSVASCLVVAKPAFSSADTAEDTWAAKAPMQQARAGLGVAVVNGKIYAIGGSTASGSYSPDIFVGGFVGTNEEYDPATDTWTTKASMPTPRDFFAIAAYKNKIYCIGGAVGFTVDEMSGFYGYITSGVNEVYDTVTDSWVTKASMPFNGMKLQANVVNGKIYVMQGFYVHVYDPADDSWTNRTRMPATPREGSVSPPVSVVVDDKIVVTGEFSTGFGSSEQKVLIYDTETDSWSEGRSGPVVVVEGAAGATTGVKAPQRVYVLGLIVDALYPTVINQVYDPKTDTWATATTMSTTRSDFGVVVVNDVLYVIGGYLRGSRNVTPTAVNEQYTPIGYGTVPPAVAVVSPENQTYNGSSVPLVFTVNKPVNWTGYSLDGQENVTLTGNTTISGLTNGLHNVTVYAKDAFENMGTSETISFSVEVPFPTTLVAAAASAATIAVVGVGLLVYFRKRKH